jgi:hypothetical protein
MNLPIKPRMPLLWATQVASQIAEMIDEAPGTIDELLDEAFNAQLVTHAEALDRQKALLWATAGNRVAARGAKKELDAYIKKLDVIEEKVLARVIQAHALEPRLPWRDSTGKKISVIDNQPALKPSFDIKKKKSFEGVLHEDTIMELDIPEKYLKTVTLKILDTEAVKADLKAGVVLTWAELETGKQVRGLKPPKDFDKELKANDDDE